MLERYGVVPSSLLFIYCMSVETVALVVLGVNGSPIKIFKDCANIAMADVATGGLYKSKDAGELFDSEK